MKKTTDTNCVNGSQKFGYLCSGISYSVCQLIPTFLIYFATENLAIAVGAVSLMIVLVKLLDGVSDFFIGMLIEHTKSKKRKGKTVVFMGFHSVCRMPCPDIQHSNGSGNGRKTDFAGSDVCSDGFRIRHYDRRCKNCSGTPYDRRAETAGNPRVFG